MHLPHLLHALLQAKHTTIVETVGIVSQDKVRQLQTGRVAEELEQAVHLTVITKCPEKYILIDQETGQSYVGSNEDNPYLPGFKLWKEIRDR